MVYQKSRKKTITIKNETGLPIAEIGFSYNTNTVNSRPYFNGCTLLDPWLPNSSCTFPLPTFTLGNVGKASEAYLVPTFVLAMIPGLNILIPCQKNFSKRFQKIHKISSHLIQGVCKEIQLLQ